MSEPVLSVVVIGRNEGERLKRCLQSIAEIAGLNGSTEIIYADSNSSDGSPELARKFGAHVVELSAKRPTAALGRNAGLALARAPYILFLDGDTIVHRDFAKTAIASLEQDDLIAAVWGHRREIHPERSIYNRVLDLDWIYAPGDTEFCGGDVVIRRGALREVQGYDPTLIAGEEPELCRRLRARGYRIVHIDCPMTGHDLAMTTWSQYWRRATRAGHAYAEVSERFRGTNDPSWSSESRGNLLRGGFWVVSLAIALVATRITPWLLVAWLGTLIVLAARSAWKNRWKAPGRWGLLFAYGVHSHLQQLPIVVGQFAYFRERWRGGESKLIEYKERGGG